MVGKRDNRPELSILGFVSRQSPHATTNEDAVGFTGSAAWVIDGATGVSDGDPLVPGTTDAAWLAGCLSENFRRGFSELGADVNAILSAAQGEIEAEYRSLDLASQRSVAEQPSAAFSLAMLSDETLCFVGIGDCSILFERHDGSIEEFNASDVGATESMIIEERQRLLRDYPGDDPLPRLKPFIRKFREHVNTSAGYSVVHPTRPWFHRLKFNTILRSEVRHVLIVSDGLYRLVDVFGVFDSAGLMKAALSNGLEHLCDRLRNLETNDEACSRFPRVKVIDDTSGVLAMISAHR
jgi:hypothetical protein